jgi:phosphoglycerate dehydrogenase-like enzyme
MSSLCVLEYVRSSDPIWNLPADVLEGLARRFPDVRFEAPADETGADRLLPEADVVWGWAVRPANFTRAGRLRWIQVTAASVHGLLFPELVESDVTVTNGRGLHGVAMAEHTLGVILAFTRKLHLARDAQRERRWAQSELWSQAPPITGLAGRTLGLVGFGAIGRATAERARTLGLEVLALRRHPDPDPTPAHAQWPPDRLPDLLGLADFVVLAAPLTRETRGLIGTAELERMRRDAILINLGRGALVDERALVAALENGTIAGAALDVFEHEPLDAESPLWGMPNVIVTPHVSGFGPLYWERAAELFARNLRAFLDGRPLENVVDKKAGY